jgi:hypothetical protein
MTVRFTTAREQLRPNLTDLRIQQVLLYFSRADNRPFEIPVTSLRLTENATSAAVDGGATTVAGVISTRSGNAASWAAMIGKTPFGEWELGLPDNERAHFSNDEIADVVLVITYAGATPAYPA